MGNTQVLGASGDSEAPGAGVVGLGDAGVLQGTVRLQGQAWWG